MKSLVEQMTGRKTVQEDVPVPVAAHPQATMRSRFKRNLPGRPRSTTSRMLGVTEANEEDGSIIPDDAEPISQSAGTTDIKVDDENIEADKTVPALRMPPEATSPGGETMMTPRDALVAPDVTPEAFDALDPGEVPAAPQAAPQAQTQQPANSNYPNPLEVLLGRGRSAAPPAAAVPEAPVVTAEAAQATINSVLQVNGSGGEGGGGLRQGVPMPEPVAGNASKIMETFQRYGPAPKSRF